MGGVDLRPIDVELLKEATPSDVATTRTRRRAKQIFSPQSRRPTASSRAAVGRSASSIKSSGRASEGEVSAFRLSKFGGRGGSIVPAWRRLVGVVIPGHTIDILRRQPAGCGMVVGFRLLPLIEARR